MSGWKVGDVAAVNDYTRPNAPWLAATCIAAAKPGAREAEWMLHRSGVRVWGSVSKARPLVVVDPEDREQIERFRNETLRMLRDHLGNRAVDESAFTEGDLANAMQAALREFANPTPTEPTDPAARVTDRRGNIWRLLADGDWVCTSGPDIGEYIVWSRLAAERGPVSVEVLS